MKKQSRALRPDAQAFDEVRITTVPRYKTSGLSGDEWRISALVQFLRNGRVFHEASFRDVKTACGYLYAEHGGAADEGKGYFAGEEDFCDQEGCSEKADIQYRVLKEFSRVNPHEWSRPAGTHRLFCIRHAKRGDCGFDDADANYELLESPSAVGDVVTVDPD